MSNKKNKIEFGPGKLGVSLKKCGDGNQKHKSAVVSAVTAGGQGEKLGVQVGWTVVAVGDNEEAPTYDEVMVYLKESSEQDIRPLTFGVGEEMNQKKEKKKSEEKSSEVPKISTAKRAKELFDQAIRFGHNSGYNSMPVRKGVNPKKYPSRAVAMAVLRDWPGEIDSSTLVGTKNNKKTYLAKAVHEGWTDVVLRLLESSAGVQKCINERWISDFTGEDPRDLMAGGADLSWINKGPHRSFTPLMEAASLGYSDMVAALLKAGADATLTFTGWEPGAQPKTPVQWAEDRKVREWEECVRLLRDHMAAPSSS